MIFGFSGQETIEYVGILVNSEHRPPMVSLPPSLAKFGM